MKICIFGASSERLAAVYYEQAESLGRLMGEGGHTMIFGGGATGLMGACARGLAKTGGETVGVAPRFFDVPAVLYEDCSRMIYTDTMAERKSLMEAEAEAFVVLPGGIGTLDEFFEVLTLAQLGRMDKPIALLNTSGFYAPMDELLRAAAAQGFLGEDVCALYTLCDSPEEALAAVLRQTQPAAPRSLKSYT